MYAWQRYLLFERNPLLTVCDFAFFLLCFTKHCLVYKYKFVIACDPGSPWNEICGLTYECLELNFNLLLNAFVVVLI